MKRVPWILRPSGPTESFPRGFPAERVVVTLSEEDWAWYQEVGKRLLAMEEGPERTAFLGEVQAQMEILYRFDAHSVPGAAEERTDANPPPPSPPVQQGELFPPPEPPRGTAEFPIPESVRDKMREAGYFERGANEQSSLDTPGDLGPEALPDPGRKRIGEFSDPAKSGAPDTQRQAAISVYYTTGSDCLKVLALLWGKGDDGVRDGLTDYEIEVAFGMKHQTASARRNQLMNDGWVKDSGRKRRTDTGRLAVVWVFTEAGRASYMKGEGRVA